MTESPTSVDLQALEAIAHDALSFAWAIVAIRQHTQAPLVVHGLVPAASMFVVESHRALKRLLPEGAAVLSGEHADLVRESRHRSKLLDDSARSIDEVTGELVRIARQRREYFLGLHTHPFLRIKRALQPDMGLSLFNGHIFSTTHAGFFAFGPGFDQNASAHSIGEVLGSYTANVLTLLGIEVPTPPSVSEDDTIEMRDIKYEALYSRGPMGSMRTDYAAGAALLLTSLNDVRYVIPQFLPPSGLTLFKLKFLVAFHADAGLRRIQAALAREPAAPAETLQVLAAAIGTHESRWLRRRRALRNLLAHYLRPQDCPAASSMRRSEAIESLAAGLSEREVDALLDVHIAHLSDTLEAGFRLAGDPFWYGKVRA